MLIRWGPEGGPGSAELLGAARMLDGHIVTHLGRAVPLESAEVKRQLLVQQLLSTVPTSRTHGISQVGARRCFCCTPNSEGSCSQSTCTPCGSAQAKAHLTYTDVDQKEVQAGMLLRG